MAERQHRGFTELAVETGFLPECDQHQSKPLDSWQLHHLPQLPVSFPYFNIFLGILGVNVNCTKRMSLFRKFTVHYRVFL